MVEDASAGDRLDALVSDARLLRLYAYWRDQRGGRRCPARADIDPIAISTLLPILFLIDVSHAPRRYRYRLIGTELAAFAGRDMTGSTIDSALYGAYAEVMCRRFDLVVDGLAPHIAFSTAHWLERKAWVKVAILILPLSPDDTTVNMLMGGIVVLPPDPAEDAARIPTDPLTTGRLVRLVEPPAS